jgi:hypothetical protein
MTVEGKRVLERGALNERSDLRIYTGFVELEGELEKSEVRMSGIEAGR